MPVIQEYNAAQNLGLATNDRAVDARNIAARTIGRLDNEAAGEVQQLGNRVGNAISTIGNSVEDYQAHKEISAGGLHSSQMLLNLQNDWNQRVKDASDKDPNDPSVQGKFLDSAEEAFGQFRDSFTTRKGQEWADSRINQLRQHLTNTTTADMSTLSGIAAHNNFIQGTNALTGLVDKDPSAIGVATSLLQDNVRSVAESSPNLKGIQAEKFKTEATQKGMEAIVKTAVQASIRRGGDGSEISDDPKYAAYITAGERQQFVTMQRQESRAANADARMARIEAKQQAQDASEKATDGYIKDLYNPDPTAPRPTAKDIIADNSILPAHREHLLKLVESRADGEPVNPTTAKTVSMQMIKDINDGKITDKNQIYAHLGKDLDQPRFDRVMAEFTGRKSSDNDTITDRRNKFLAQYGPIVNPANALGEHEDAGHVRQYNLYDLGLKTEARLRSEGKNPQDAYDPQSKDFVGRMPEAQPVNPALLMQETQRKKAEANQKLTPDDTKVLTQYPDARRDATGRWFVIRNGQKMIATP